MADQCPCLNCTFARFLRDRFPNGFSADDSVEALTAIAAVSGWILASGTDRSLDSFFKLVTYERDSYLQEDRRQGGGLH